MQVGGALHLAIIAAVFPVIFLGELPDKSMFASVVLASRGRPLAVWVGAAAAFAVHVAIAVSIGVALVNLLPHRVVDALVAVLFAAGAVYTFAIRNQSEDAQDAADEGSSVGTGATAFGVIFLSEWGDLTQVLTANMAARYHSPWSVGVGAALALWAVAGLAVVGGRGLLRLVPVKTVRIATTVVLLVLAGLSAAKALGV